MNATPAVEQQPPGAGKPFTMPIEYGKIREFAKATKSRSDIWLEDTGRATPPTFLATMLFWATDESLPYTQQGFNAERVLHGGREYVFHSPPPRAGDRLVAQQRIEDTYTKPGRRGGQMRFVVALTEFRNDAGELVVEMRNTTIETGKPAVDAS